MTRIVLRRSAWRKMMGDREATAVEAARFGSAGGLHTTPTDYAKFLVEVIGPKPNDAYRLGPKSLKEMVRTQVKVTETVSWGLGRAIEHTTAGDIISHSGDNPGYKALAGIDAAETRFHYHHERRLRVRRNHREGDDERTHAAVSSRSAGLVQLRAC